MVLVPGESALVIVENVPPWLFFPETCLSCLLTRTTDTFERYLS